MTSQREGSSFGRPRPHFLHLDGAASPGPTVPVSNPSHSCISAPASALDQVAQDGASCGL